VPGFDTVVTSAFYQVFQDDEGMQTRYAQTLHGASEPVRGLFMFEFGNATTSTAFNGKACRPNAIEVAAEPRCAMAAAQEATAFDRITAISVADRIMGECYCAIGSLTDGEATSDRAVVVGADHCS
jgi:hypothetical protein